MKSSSCFVDSLEYSERGEKQVLRSLLWRRKKSLQWVSPTPTLQTKNCVARAGKKKKKKKKKTNGYGYGWGGKKYKNKKKKKKPEKKQKQTKKKKKKKKKKHLRARVKS